MLKPSLSDDAYATVAERAATASTIPNRSYLFRGDDNYRGGTVGRALGAEADSSDIQSISDHVLRKESGITSRFTSFSEEVKVARKFTSSSDNRYVYRADLGLLRDLETAGTIRLWSPEDVYAMMKASNKKQSNQAADVRSTMVKNSEILVEGQIPESVLSRAN